MATTAPHDTHRDAFALRPVFDRDLPDGAWWPQNRSLNEQLKRLFAQWPREAGRIHRLLYSPPDWDDHPRMVDVGGRFVRTGSFPEDDTHVITLTMSDRQRRFITVIPPDASVETADQVLAEIVQTPETAASVASAT